MASGHREFDRFEIEFPDMVNWMLINMGIIFISMIYQTCFRKKIDPQNFKCLVTLDFWFGTVALFGFIIWGLTI